MSSKGISPLVAAVLLIAFTMAVAGLFSSWAPELLQGIQSDTSDDTESLLEASRAGLGVDSAVFDSSSGNTSVVFRNTGQVELGNFTVTARLEDGGFVQKQVDQELDSAGIVGVELNTSSAPDLVRVDSENLDVSAETDSVSGAGSTNGGSGDGDGGSVSVSGAPSFSTAPSGAEYESSWVPVEPDTSVQNGFSYFFDETSDEEYYNVSEGFYVMKYEAKPYNTSSNSFDVSSGTTGSGDWASEDYVPRSVAANKPWRDISFNEGDPANGYGAVQACEALDSQTSEFDVHLLTNREWMTVARQVEQTDSNWVSDPQQSSGQLIRGNSDASEPYRASTDDGEGLYNLPTGGDDDLNNRTFELANGEVVWDWAGNVRQWVDVEEDGEAVPSSKGDGISDGEWSSLEGGFDDPWSMNKGDTTGKSVQYEYGPLESAYANKDNGVGYNYNIDGGDAALRGGYWGNGVGAGVFYAFSITPDSTFSFDGFRCSAVPVS